MKKMKLSDWIIALDDMGPLAAINQLEELAQQCPDRSHSDYKLLIKHIAERKAEAA